MDDSPSPLQLARDAADAVAKDALKYGWEYLDLDAAARRYLRADLDCGVTPHPRNTTQPNMRRRWEVVWHATDPIWGQSHDHHGGDYLTRRGAAWQVQLMNRLGNGTRVTTYEMRRRENIKPVHWRVVFSGACIVWSLVFAPLAVYEKMWWAVGIHVVALVVASFSLVSALREVRDGSRSAAGDSDDSGTATSTVAAANIAAAGALASGTGYPIGAITSAGKFTIRNGSGVVVRSVGTDEMQVLAERVDDTPILAYKTALLLWQLGDEFGPYLTSMFTPHAYDQSDRAVCHRGADHDVPSLGCTCGFYAVRDPKAVGYTLESSVLLDVELFGRVIVFEHGYRAERQRILRIGLAGCWYCNQAPSCIAGDAPTPWQPTQQTPLVPLCDEHLPFARANIVYRLPELEERLGAPVGHAPELNVDQQRQVGS